MQRADFLENVLLIFPTLCWMGSEKHEKEEQWLRCWLAYYCRLLPYCLPSFSFNATAQEHTLHSLKEKGLYYFDGTQNSSVAMARCFSGSLELEGREEKRVRDSVPRRQRASHA